MSAAAVSDPLFDPLFCMSNSRSSRLALRKVDCSVRSLTFFMCFDNSVPLGSGNRRSPFGAQPWYVCSCFVAGSQAGCFESMGCTTRARTTTRGSVCFDVVRNIRSVVKSLLVISEGIFMGEPRSPFVSKGGGIDHICWLYSGKARSSSSIYFMT